MGRRRSRPRRRQLRLAGGAFPQPSGTPHRAVTLGLFTRRHKLACAGTFFFVSPTGCLATGTTGARTVSRTPTLLPVARCSRPLTARTLRDSAFQFGARPGAAGSGKRLPGRPTRRFRRSGQRRRRTGRNRIRSQSPACRRITPRTSRADVRADIGTNATFFWLARIRGRLRILLSYSFGDASTYLSVPPPFTQEGEFSGGRPLFPCNMFPLPSPC